MVETSSPTIILSNPKLQEYGICFAQNRLHAVHKALRRQNSESILLILFRRLPTARWFQRFRLCSYKPNYKNGNGNSEHSLLARNVTVKEEVGPSAIEQTRRLQDFDSIRCIEIPRLFMKDSRRKDSRNRQRKVAIADTATTGSESHENVVRYRESSDFSIIDQWVNNSISHLPRHSVQFLWSRSTNPYRWLLRIRTRKLLRLLIIVGTKGLGEHVKLNV